MTGRPHPAFRRLVREEREHQELTVLAPAATLSTSSRGRKVSEIPDRYRTAFERDRDRILHAKAFRRLKHKTQVFMNPEGDHYVTRLTHTLKVTQIGRSIGRALSLNEPLVEAVCLGHDVGHSPFGHTGEEALSEFVADGWRHSDQSVRIFEVLEPLNLTYEVLDGIKTHPWNVATDPSTPESGVVRFADRIAYLAHDAEDAIRAGMLDRGDFPPAAIEAFGEPGRQWIQTMIAAVVDDSLRVGEISMATDILGVMHDLRAFMFETVYLRPEMEPQRRRAKEVVRGLVEFYLSHPGEIPESYRHEGSELPVQVIDYVAGMTDRFAIRSHDELFRPRLF